MSGMKNLANAIATDPKFAKEAGMSAAEAKQFVDDGKAAKAPAGKSQNKGK